MFGLKVCDKLLLLLNICLHLSYIVCNSVQNTSFTAPQLRSGGWTPIPATTKNLSQQNGDKIASESIQVSSKLQKPNDNKKLQDSEMLPIPVIKPHRHGATLGFDLPEQGLTLYLDINELATKPMAQNIGLKVVSHETHQALQSQAQPLKHVKPTSSIPSRQSSASSVNNQLYNGNESPLSQFVNKIQSMNNNNNNNNSPKANAPITVAKIQKRVKSARNIGSYEGISNSPTSSGSSSTITSASKPVLNKYHVGYMRPHDLQTVLKQVGYNHGNGNGNGHNVQLNGNNGQQNGNSGQYNGNGVQHNGNGVQHNGNGVQHNGNNGQHNGNNGQHSSNIGQHNGNNHNNLQNNNPTPNTRTVIINTHSLNNNNLNYNKLFNNGAQNEPKKASTLDTFSPNPSKYFGPISSLNQNFVPQINSNGNQNENGNGNRPALNAAPQPSSYSYTPMQMPIRPSVQFPIQEQEKERPNYEVEQQKPEHPVQQSSHEEDFDNEVTIKRTTTESPALPPQREDEQQRGFDDDIEQTTESFGENRFEEPQRQVSNEEEREQQIDSEKNKQTTVSLSMQTTNGRFTPPPEDDTIIKPFPGGPVPQELGDIPLQTCPSLSQMCQQICDAKTDNLISEASNIREIIQKLNADSLINAFPSLEEELQNIIDFASSDGYTIILPSNEAVSRLPPNLFEFWKNNVNSLSPLLDSHVVDKAQSLEEMRLAEIIQPRSASKLRVRRAHNDSYTINGERVTIGNQVGPSGGQIHVIDGILYPNSDKDILETLKTCNRLDGFVTLAEGTGFADTLKQPGPFTVFVPSNEALQKVPDNDLDIIRNNMTALREFLKYHVAKGSYFSNDLKDGQYIPSLMDGQYIQMGVRVDGCRRRLVEANVSPLYRADIPASNGVIHVVDWILKPTDRDWCENVILPR